MIFPAAITCDADLAAHCTGLAVLEPRFAYAVEKAGAPPVRLREVGFPALLKLIVEQQLSVAAADGIWARMDSVRDPAALLAQDDETLRAMGLSRPKARYARALATAISSGALDLEAVKAMRDEEAIKALTAITGIGRWTAECYLMFSLGRPDLFPAADLALQEGAKRLFDLPERPKARELAERAATWSPHRGAAARILWAYLRATA